MSSSVPYDPYIPSGGSAAQGAEGGAKTAAIQAVSSDFVWIASVLMSSLNFGLAIIW
jgi:hypothetical protein